MAEQALSQCREGFLWDPACHWREFIGSLGAWTPLLSSALVLVSLWLILAFLADLWALRSGAARQKRFGWLAGDAGAPITARRSSARLTALRASSAIMTSAARNSSI